MNSKRFTVRSFRGYAEVDDYDSAVTCAQLMILGIKEDGWCDEYWWSEIIDNQRSVSLIVSVPYVGVYSCTPWLFLR